MGRFIATVCLLFSIVAAATVAQDQAAAPQPEKPATDTPPTPAAAAEAPLGLDEHLAQQAYLESELWMHQGKVPEEAIESILTTGLTAIQATIRRNGITSGTGTASVLQPAAEATNESVDLTLLLRSAVTQALLDDRSKPKNLRDDHPDLTLDLQFAGPLQPLRLGNLGELPAQVKLNLDGMALHQNNRWAWGFPGGAIASNSNLKSQLTRMLAQEDLGLSLTDLPNIGTENGPELYRFRVIHITRPTPTAEVVSLHRGQLLNPVAALDEVGIYQLSQLMAKHLIARQREDGRFSGTYDPSGDQFIQPLASQTQAAMAAFALARSAKVYPVESPQYQDRVAAARMALDQLLQLPAEEADRTPSSINDTAVLLLALLETPGMGQQTKTLWRLSTQLHVYLKMPEGQFHISYDGQGHGHAASLHTQALATATMVRLYGLSRNPDFLERAQNCLNYTWTLIDQDPEMASTAMPWLAYAETDLARLDKRQPTADRLVKLVNEFWRKQVMPWDLKAAEQSPDVFGGFSLETGLYPEPNWHSSRILTACSLVLGTDGLVPADQKSNWLVNAAYAARFLDQLTFKPSGCFYVRNPAAAVGGLRLAFWNNQLPLDSTALGLLATAELQHCMKALIDPAAPGSLPLPNPNAPPAPANP